MKKIVKDFYENKQVRVLQDANGNLCLVANDVARLLGYGQAGNIARLVDDSGKTQLPGRTPVGEKMMTCLTYSGLIQLLLASRRDDTDEYVTEIMSTLITHLELSRLTEKGHVAARVALDVACKQSQVLASNPVKHRNNADWALLIHHHAKMIMNSANPASHTLKSQIEELAARCHIWLAELEEEQC